MYVLMVVFLGVVVPVHFPISPAAGLHVHDADRLGEPILHIMRDLLEHVGACVNARLVTLFADVVVGDTS